MVALRGSVDSSRMTTAPTALYRIFMVEDCPLIRSRLGAMLAKCPGVQLVGEAESVASAIEGIAATDPEALVLDLQIIGGSGLDVLKAVQRTRPKLRVAVVSNWATAQHRKVCQASGVEHLLDKSFQLMQLLDIVSGWAIDARSGA
jgi:DNA-binding NarL/FixJ family response regulator